MRCIALGMFALTATTLFGCMPDPKERTKPSGTTAAPAPEAATTDGKALFDQTCVACHSIGGGDRTGPDLKDVSKRRDKVWLTKWMKDPIGMGQNDAVGKELMAKFKNVPMPNPNLNEMQIEAVLAYIDAESAKGGSAVEEVVALTGDKFDQAKGIYFDRCAGCHGTLRAGATGPNIQPERTKKIGGANLRTILTNGTPGGMPAWGREGVLTADQIALMATYVQMDPPAPPELPLEKIKGSWKVLVPPDKRPKKPETKRNWENYFGVILRDAGKVAIIDGDTKEQVALINTGFAVHILRASSTGRYFLAVGRDGKITMIDLWTETPTVVAQVQGCFDARSVDGSKAPGWEDKLVIEGCYWPPQYVVYDGATLEPKSVTSVLGETYDTKEQLKEVRVAGIYALHDEPLWAINLKESGFVGFVDYSKPDFPMVKKVAADRFLHDGGWDHYKKYLLVAANMQNKMAVVDVKKKETVALIETGSKPHPGRGANWLDPKFGWVNATTHIGEGKLTIYGADPEKSPEHAWKIVRKVDLPAAGGLFLKTHDKSPWVWTDSPLSADEKGPRQICVYSKKDAKIEKCWAPTDRGRMVHFEYDKNGEEVWVSLWDRAGELVVYDDKTLTEKARIKGDWMVTPTGKFNVYNTAHDVY
ncbi:MAG: c-type cytochrome [Polyangiaceae bacterium]|nr:c-type cytochrome [Polyangiaceae bacterium]